MELKLFTLIMSSLVEFCF